MPETVLIVDDEDPVRRTFAEWLAYGGRPLQILTAADAEQALGHANTTAIDLAVLDWNLGTGSDGLQLLEDLAEFCPDVAAILVTGFAHQATPLAALRMGVRDYLDKNHELTRDNFLTAVHRQLDRIAPLKRQRELTHSLATFRSAVERILPVVRQSRALTDPVPLPRAVAALCRFLMRLTGAADAVLLLHGGGDDGPDYQRAFDADGRPIAADLLPFARSLAASAVGLNRPCASDFAAVQRQPFEVGRSAVLAAPLAAGGDVAAVLELFDKPGGFTESDRELAAAAGEIGAALLHQALAERQAFRSLFDAVEAALQLTGEIGSAEPLPEPVRAPLRSGPGGDAAVELAEAVRSLAQRHGDAAVRHCAALVAGVRAMLDDLSG